MIDITFKNTLIQNFYYELIPHVNQVNENNVDLTTDHFDYKCYLISISNLNKWARINSNQDSGHHSNCGNDK